MRRASLAVLALLALAPPASAQGLPPHAWLFGTWTGGFFPVEGHISPVACLAQPVVIFTKDVVLRATLTSQTYVQRVIETARGTANGVEFRFTSVPQPPAGSDLLGLSNQSPTGFGCGNADVLHVARSPDNGIVFPGCIDFPYPLVRCPNVPAEGSTPRTSRR